MRTPRISLSLCLISAACFCARAVHAETDILRDDESPDDASRAPVVSGLRPGAIAMLTGEELIARGYRTLSDALADVVGLVRTRAIDAIGFDARGIRNGLALVIDDMPIGLEDERGSFELGDAIALVDVARVEVVRGPTSASNGAAALSGAVLVYTKKAASTSMGQRIGVTSRGEGDASVGVDLANDASALHLAARVRSGPAQLWRFERIPTRFLRVGRAVLPGTKVDRSLSTDDDASLYLRANASVGKASLDSSFASDERHIPISSFSHVLLEDEPERRAIERAQLRLSGAGKLASLAWRAAAFGARIARDDRIVPFPKDAVFPYGGDVSLHETTLLGGAALHVEFPIAVSHRVLGELFAEVADRSAASDVTDPLSGRRTERLVEIDDLVGRSSGAVEYQIDLASGWHATLGGVAEWRTGFVPVFLPRVAVFHVPFPWLSLRLAYGEGARAPDPFEMAALTRAIVGDLAVGAEANDALRQERSRTVELGATLKPSAAFSASVDAYGSRHENVIESDAHGTRVRPINGPPRHILGVELSLDATLWPRWFRVCAGASSSRGLDAGDDRNRDVSQLLVAVEAMPIALFELGARSRALYVGGDGPARGGSHVASVYAHLRPAGDVFSIAVVVDNVFDGLERFDDVAILPNAAEVAVPGSGRTFFVAVEGHL